MVNMKLIVGVESTWSLRAWLCAQIANITFDEVVIPLGEPNYQALLSKYSNTRLVPVLIDGNIVIHDSLAIAEYLNELSKGRLYPKNAKDRACARSLCAELHSGFVNIRSRCPFSTLRVENVKITNELAVELSRIKSIFSRAQVDFMYGTPTAVDAFYAILAFRLSSYGIDFNGKAGVYQASLLEWPLLQQAVKQAQKWKLVGS